MGWAIGYDTTWNRDVGYGVPATCDHPGCGAEIDRGIGYVCGGDVFGGDEGCGLFFCGKHKGILCERCSEGKEPFTPTPDTAEWNHHKLTDPSWAEWREKFPDEVKRLSAPKGGE